MRRIAHAAFNTTAGRITTGVAGLTIVAGAAVGLAPKGGEAPVVAPTNSAPETSGPAPAESLTCEEYGATIEIPAVDSAEGQAFIAERFISGDVAPEDVPQAVADLEIEWLTAGIEYLPSDPDTLTDCYLNYSEAELGPILQLDKVSALHAAAELTEDPNAWGQNVQDGTPRVMAGIAHRFGGNLLVKPNSSAEGIQVLDLAFNTKSISTNKVVSTYTVNLALGGTAENDIQPIVGGGTIELDKETNRWITTGPAS